MQKNLVHKNYSIKNEIQSCKAGLLVKTFYEFKEISLDQRAFRTEYPQEGTPSHSVIKNILSNFEKYGSVALVPPKFKNSEPSRDMVKNQLENMVSEFHQL